MVLISQLFGSEDRILRRRIAGWTDVRPLSMTAHLPAPQFGPLVRALYPVRMADNHQLGDLAWAS